MKRFKLINRLALSKRKAAFTKLDLFRKKLSSQVIKPSLALWERAEFQSESVSLKIRNSGEGTNIMRGAVAFTLAEVLITLGIIGVVAALVLSSFIQDMSERINSNKQANIAQKITKSMELMIVNGDYQDITTTEQLVDKLSKYLKIIKRCDSEHLTDCWPTSTIKTSMGKTYNVADAKNGVKLHTQTTTTNVGLVLADGTPIIINFNPSAPAINAESNFLAKKEVLPVGKGKTDSFAYTSSATEAIDFVMDVNGATGPNQETDGENYFDIRSFRIASFSINNACKKEDKIEGMCIKDLGTRYIPLNRGGSDVDYLGGAIQACEDLGLQLTDKATLFYLYDNYKGQGNVPSEGVYWTSNEWSYNTYFVTVDMSNKTIKSPSRTTSNIKALCYSR